MIHGAIDGYSSYQSMIMYLQPNNLAASIHGLPSRVREDIGAKNVDVVQFKLGCPEGGIKKGSFMAQCIEGL